jgi:peptidoglycan/LPS O-acetylase OafA/YrhL
MSTTYLPAFMVFSGNFLMPDYGGVKTVLSVIILWSVCVEEQFYLL